MGNHSQPALTALNSPSILFVCEHLNLFSPLVCSCDRQKIINVLGFFFFSLSSYELSYCFSNFNHHRKHLGKLFSIDSGSVGLG